MNRFKVTLLMLVLLALVITAPLAFAAPKAAPVVVIYNNSGVITSGAMSKKEQVEEIKQWLQKKTGVEVTVIVPPPGQEENKLNLILAGNDQLDAFWGDWTKYQPKGALMPINDLLNKYGPNIKKTWPKGSWDAMTDKNGKIWGIPRVASLMGNPLWIRTDWLQKLNLKMPTTIDEYEVVLKAFKDNKPGGEGTIPLLAEVRGKHASRGLHNTLVGAFTPYGYANWYDTTDKKLKPSELQPGFKDFLAKMHDWYEKGYIYPEFASLDRPRIKELIRLNKVGSAATWMSNVTLTKYFLNQTVPEADYAIPPGGISGPKGKGETIRPASLEGILFSARSKNAASTMKVINFLYSDIENHMIGWYGPVGSCWEWVDKSKGIYRSTKPKVGYYSEYAFSVGLYMEIKTHGTNPEMEKHQWYLEKEATNFSRGKMPVDSGVIYDPKVIQDKVPGYADLERMKEEEEVKFITGARPLSEYDEFIKELYKAGLDKWIEAHTQMFKAQKNIK